MPIIDPKNPPKRKAEIQKREFALESKLQREVIVFIKNKYQDNVWFYKTHDQCRVGVPDIVMCFYGHFVAIELKRELVRKNKRYAKRVDQSDKDEYFKKRDGEMVIAKKISQVTPLQKYNLKKISTAQGSAFIGYSLGQIMSKLDKIRESFNFFGE